MVSMITPAQCRAARGLLDWTQQELGERAGLSGMSVRAFERGRPMRESNREAVRAALEAGGVAFIDQNGGGPGVRLRNSEG
jgi:transcriptional regulator with XRE-family HTH domain